MKKEVKKTSPKQTKSIVEENEKAPSNDLKALKPCEEQDESVDEFYEDAVVEEDDLPPHVDVKPDTPPKKKKLGKVTGMVYNCHALRLREGANIKTKELAIIPANTLVSINLDNSTESFYEVTYEYDKTTLIGFCLKDFITLDVSHK